MSLESRRNRLNLFCLIFLLFHLHSACPLQAQVEMPARSFMLTFYNVENLYDTINDPRVDDDEFLPESKKNWSSARYKDKLEKLASVLTGMSKSPPAIIGLCEVENRKVLEDLVKQFGKIGKNYGIIHYDSPDQRGIDVAMLYDKKLVKVIRSEAIPVPLPEGERPTRDILYARLTIGKHTPVHLFVNHWPSRSGGADATEQKRIEAANIIRERVNNLLSVDKDAHIIAMGDFNDYPENVSLRKYLGARKAHEDGPLVNLMDNPESGQRGSYQYRGEWGFLDQIIVSRSFMNGVGLEVVSNSAGAFAKEGMFFSNSRGEESPNRSYGGDTYYGGYSDHLPVYAIFKY